jgi:hypothetical protein
MTESYHETRLDGSKSFSSSRVIRETWALEVSVIPTKAGMTGVWEGLLSQMTQILEGHALFPASW